MLNERGIPYEYREYRKEPLSQDELMSVLAALGVRAADVLRNRDRMAKELGLTGTESDAELVPLMAEHPTLLQRPIGVSGGRAVVGRPPERLLELANG